MKWLTDTMCSRVELSAGIQQDIPYFLKRTPGRSLISKGLQVGRLFEGAEVLLRGAFIVLKASLTMENNGPTDNSK